jgi:hypothetical protein
MTGKKTRLRWTEEDVRPLRLFADANVSADTIAKSLGRLGEVEGLLVEPIPRP